MKKFLALALLILPSIASANWQSNYKCKEKIRLRNMTKAPIVFTFYAVKDLKASRKQIRLAKNQRVDEVIYWNENYCSSYGFGEVWFDGSIQPGEQRKKYKVRSSNWYRFEHKNEDEIDLFYYCSFDKCLSKKAGL